MAIPRQARRLAKKVLPAGLATRIARWDFRRRDKIDVEAQMLPLFARGGDFVDIGANIGVWSMCAAPHFRTVYCFEPDRTLAQGLRSLPRNVKVHGMALSDHVGEARLTTPVISGVPAPSRSSLEERANGDAQGVDQVVALGRLDDFNLERVDAMKVDVEGHEAAVFNGAWRTIEACRPMIVAEIEERHHVGDSETIIAAVVSRGYGCWYVHRGELKRFVPGSVAELQKNPPLTVDGREEDYMANFIFLPQEREKENCDAMLGWLGKARGR